MLYAEIKPQQNPIAKKKTLKKSSEIQIFNPETGEIIVTVYFNHSQGYISIGNITQRFNDKGVIE